MLELAKLIDLIVGFASPIVQSKLQRSELAIKLLKQLHLDPDHPPADFTAVYQYTLVEYGIGKPKPVLELFRQGEIQDLFRQALDQNNSSLLLKEGEAFLAGHRLGEQIQALGIDARQEFYQFAAVFIEVAKRTRTPAEVLANQKLESLHRQVGTIQERLHRLPTLEGLRTEMARLATQNYPVLPGAIATPALAQAQQLQERQCRAFALAQQMKGWFETLGYRFESYEVWQDDYFEWIIDIPVRRGRYDRILVRGIDGEVGLRDLQSLRQSVETQRADEGWLVTARRISRAAREAVEQEENHDLGCYTFDELLDQDADFSGYLDWLEAEIQRRGIEQKYVPLACTKEEIDPDTKQRLGVSRYDDRDGWIDGYIDLWLDDPVKEHISVLGEFGTGKTWFAFHYASQALQRYREAQQRGVERPRLPLVIPLRDYAKAVSVESLFSEFFFRKHEVRSLTYSAFEQLNRMGKLLLLFDGFDEMAARVDRQEMINNFWELAKVVVPGAKVILTCRTEHFPEAREGRALLNAELQASTSNLTGETPQFEVLELEKFSDEQIRQVLSLQAEASTVEQVLGNPQLLDLARRPVMTELILEALPDIEAGKPVDMSRVYLYAVRRKMERDIKEERTFTSLAEKLYFLCELSWEMLSSDRMSLNYREFPDRIRRLFGSVVQEEKDLDHWHYDMMGQTMLIRNAGGDYMPAHRSLLEFFVAYKFAAELGVLHEDFLGVAQEQRNINHALESKSYTWSSFCHQGHNPNKTDKLNSPLKNFSPEPFSNLKKTFGLQALSPAVLELIQKMIVADRVWAILSINELADVEDNHYVGGNCLTLLGATNENLKGQNFSGLNLKGANFDTVDLNGTNFSSSNLTEANFKNVSFENTNFSSSDLHNTNFEEYSNVLLFMPFEEAGFFLCIKNQWIYQSSINTSVETEKLIFVGKGSWNLYAVKEKGFFLLQKESNLLRFWQFEQKKFTWIKEFIGSPIKEIAYDDASNNLLLLRANNDIESWSFYPLEIQASFRAHASVNGISYSESENTNILVTVGKDALDEVVKVWQVQDKNPTFTLLYTLEKSKYENVSVNTNKNHLVFSTREVLAERSLQIRVYSLLNGQHIHTSAMEYELNIWSLNLDHNIVCFIKDNKITIKNYLSGEILTEIMPEEDPREIRYIGLFSPEDEDYFILIADYPKFVKCFYINEFDKEPICTHNLLKELNDNLHSTLFNFKDNTLIAGSQNGKIYMWNYQDGSLMSKLSLHFEYSGMQLGNARNLAPSTFAWLKKCGVLGLPIMDDVAKLRAALRLVFKEDISEAAKNNFLILKSLISEQFGSENPLSSYFDTLENLKRDAVTLEQSKILELNNFVEEIDWKAYPKILKYLELFLETL